METLKVFTTEEILTMPIFSSENVLNFLKKDNKELADKFVVLEKKLEEDFQENKRKRAQENNLPNRIQNSKASPLTIELLDLLEELKHNGLYHYRTALASKYKPKLPWDDQNNFERLIKGTDIEDKFQDFLNVNPFIKLKLHKKNQNMFTQVKNAYERQNPQLLTSVCQKVLAELTDFSSNEKEKIVQELINHTFPNKEGLRKYIQEEIEKTPTAIISKLYKRKQNLYKDFISVTSPADFYKVKLLQEKINQTNLEGAEKQALIRELQRRTEKFDNGRVIVEHVLRNLKNTNETLYKEFKDDSKISPDLKMKMKEEETLDYLSENLLKMELKKRQKVYEKIDRYKEIVRQEGLIDAIVHRIEADKKENTEIKRVLISEIKDLTLKNQESPLSIFKKEYILKKYLEQELRGMMKQEQGENVKEYEGLFSSINEIKHEANQEEYTAAVNQIHKYKKLINENQFNEIIERNIKNNEVIFSKNKECFIAELKDSSLAGTIKESGQVDKMEIEKKNLCAVIFKSYFQDAKENALIKIEEYEQNFFKNPLEVSKLKKQIEQDQEIPQQMRTSLVKKLEKHMSNMAIGATQVVKNKTLPTLEKPYKKNEDSLQYKLKAANRIAQTQSCDKEPADRKVSELSR
ncbi:hypothetical protein [Enterococcus ratti]|nr:hypothetical protein [Enterococcus ratti]